MFGLFLGLLPQVVPDVLMGLFRTVYLFLRGSLFFLDHPFAGWYFAFGWLICFDLSFL